MGLKNRVDTVIHDHPQCHFYYLHAPTHFEKAEDLNFGPCQTIVVFSVYSFTFLFEVHFRVKMAKWMYVFAIVALLVMMMITSGKGGHQRSFNVAYGLHDPIFQNKHEAADNNDNPTTDETIDRR